MEAAAWVPRAGVGLMYLHVACNDPDSGVFDHRAHAINIGSIELEAMSWTPPRFVDLGDRIRLAGKHWPIVGGKEWVGNWCWNAYTLSDGKTKTERWWLTDFVTWLRDRQLYQLTTAPESFFDWWEGDRVGTPANVHGWICDAIEERYQ